ncbi:pilus assembly protein TadG-related protein [Afifella aestuarii]|uniref:pilus assembly protein TadG-related protein n=1 Tax=Afifella aestuarii TaxID=1909496 RepID=UPI001FECC8E3|nr:pilus assembly protein TadG-related protein [Afifella aestuarii]
MLCSLRRLFYRYLRREDGSVAPLIGFSALGLIVVIGFAIDVGRAQLVQAKLLNAADAGGLAAGSRIHSTNVQDEVEQFVRANFPDGYANAHIASVKAELNDSKTTVTVDASARVPTTFMKLLGFKTLTVSAHSEVTRKMTGLEVVMVLDNTGSMGSSMGALKTAAKTLVDALFGDDAVGENLYVGLVPFSQAVNVGKSHKDWLTTADITDPDEIDYGQSAGYEWEGCVEARPDGYDVTDDPPSAKKFDPYYWPDSSRYDWIKTTPGSRYCDGPLILGFICLGTWRESPGTKTYEITKDQGPNYKCPQVVTRMTPIKANIISGINNMSALGNTYLNIGAVWGWRMLSPSWRGLWGGDMETYNLPLDYENNLISKAAILMTDGRNEVSGALNDYAAYGSLWDGRLGTTNQYEADKELNERLSMVCKSMNTAGIKVYTIVFRTTDPSIQKLMRECASDPSLYFDSPDPAALKSAFEQIGDSLSNLRVSR